MKTVLTAVDDGHELLELALEPLKPYLCDRDVQEILLNPDGCIWVERAGANMVVTPVRFSPIQAELLVREIAAAVGLEIHAKEPSLACRLPIYGARVQALVPPTVPVPVFNFRLPAAKVFSLENYVESGVLTLAQAAFLADAVLTGQTILVGGGTGSGKTTLGNALLNVLVDTKERVLIVEDNVELQCPVPNTTAILVERTFTWNDASKVIMRMRPDRIIVGELRDGVALEFLKAAITHRGSIATLHANSTRSMLDRMCTLIEEAIPHADRMLVADTIQLCVHIQRDPRHPAGRSISGIDRVLGYDASASKWVMEPACPR